MATDEPEIAAKPPQARIVRSRSTPRKWPISVLAARNSSRLMPETDTKAPISRNHRDDPEGVVGHRPHGGLADEAQSRIAADQHGEAADAHEPHGHADRHPQKHQGEEDDEPADREPNRRSFDRFPGCARRPSRRGGR